jgi:hypothetical protein
MAGVVGAGAPGGAANRTPIPTNAAPATPVVTYWRADLFDPRDLVLECMDKVKPPLECRLSATGSKSCCALAVSFLKKTAQIYNFAEQQVKEGICIFKQILTAAPKSHSWLSQFELG